MQLVPYLEFDGNCADAIAFYSALLEAETETLTFAQMPPSPEAPTLTEAQKRLVMHSQLLHKGRVLLYASDTLPQFCATGGYQRPAGLRISINVDSQAEGQRLFEALAAGGKIDMPFAKTFWAAGFGLVTDRFGTPWMVNAELTDDHPPA